MEVIFKYFNKNQPNYSRTDWSNIRYDFQTSLLSLIAYMMKADGHPRKVELEFVRPHLYRILGDTQAPRALLQLRELLKNNINFYEVTQVINHSLDETSKCNILSILYGIAMADGTMTAEEWQMLVRITEYIGLSRRDLETIRMMYGNNSYGYNGQSYQSNINTSYEILGISPSATNEEVKRAYRTLVKKFHPDMLANLSKEAQEDAQKRFVKIQEAYEKICEARGIK
ncbi:MAG: TerB family tellurite resistance protein [Bacteroidia bacterium]|nr:TerB family tellurite resistance protein [Bacteroidia bacterium]